MEKEFDAVRDLIRQTVQEAAKHGDPLAILTTVSRSVVESEADPYLLLGVLVGGIVATITQKIPAERRQLVGAEVCQMVIDHLNQRT